MKRYLAIMSAFLVAVLCSMAAVNYTVDPANVYHPEYTDSVFAGVAKGKNATDVVSMDERQFKKLLLEHHRGEHFNYVILGPSTMMTLSTATFRGAKILNLEVGGSKLEDTIAFYQMLRDNNITADTYIVSVLQMDFNAKYKDDGWRTFAPEYHRFYGEDYNSISQYWGKAKNLFSVSYLSACVRRLYLHATQGERPFRHVDTDYNERMTFRPDGSLVWTQAALNTPTATVVNTAESVVQTFQYIHYDELSPDRLKLFNDLIEAMQGDGCKIALFPMSFIPCVEDDVRDIPGIAATRKYVKEYAQERGLDVIGGFNAAAMGITNDGYHDLWHPRSETLDTIVGRWLDAKQKKT